MKEYKEQEWIEIINKNREGSLSILGINLSNNRTIESLRIHTKLSGTLYARGELFASDITEIQGQKQFVFTPEGITLMVDALETFRFSTVVPKGIEHPRTIPFNVWINDYKTHNNLVHKANEDKIDSISIVGCQINKEGIIRSLNAKVTWGENYGQFGKLTTQVSLEIARDILGFTYDMRRNDFVYDDWTPNCFGDHGYRAYFTDEYDVVFADDGRYSGMPPKIND